MAGCSPNERQGAQKDRKVLRSAACRFATESSQAVASLDWQTEHGGSMTVAASLLLGFAFCSFNSVCSPGFVTTFQKGQFRTEFGGKEFGRDKGTAYLLQQFLLG
jgi:hypothetical protein